MGRLPFYADDESCPPNPSDQKIQALNLGLVRNSPPSYLPFAVKNGFAPALYSRTHELQFSSDQGQPVWRPAGWGHRNAISDTGWQGAILRFVSLALSRGQLVILHFKKQA